MSPVSYTHLDVYKRQVLKSVMNSQASKNLLQNDSFGSKALTVNTLDNMMRKAKTTPKFKSYNTIYEKAGYLITKSLEGKMCIRDRVCYARDTGCQSAI